MTENSLTEDRKTDHLRINLENDVQSGVSTGLEKYRFIHEALPELDLEDVEISQIFFGKRLALPILISSMTGGTTEGFQINSTLAKAAELSGIAMGIGSQRVALEKREMQSSFQMRKFAPNALLFANLGAVQLNYGLGVDDCRRAVEMIEADAIILHLNPLQEALQPEGNTNFKGLLSKIEMVCHSLEVPVIVKEVGWGISANTARRLAGAGVQVIDVAGAGGTSWSQVEKYRLTDEYRQTIAGAFKNWGISTAESIQMVAQAVPQVKIIASGGLKDGIDIVKCICLGAQIGGLAGSFLKVATKGTEETLRLINAIAQEIRICMFAVGVKNLQGLQEIDCLKRIE
jgi:isopentenyl-diphosphate delta-isomerase